MSGKFNGLTDVQWEIIFPLLPKKTKGVGRPNPDFRKILNTILYVEITGCLWCKEYVQLFPEENGRLENSLLVQKYHHRKIVGKLSVVLLGCKESFDALLYVGKDEQSIGMDFFSFPLS